MRLLACVLAASLQTACAGNPAPEGPAALDPVGTYDFSTTVDGTPVQGTIVISRSGDGGYTGTVSTNVTEPIPVVGVAVEGQTLTVTGQTPDGPVNMIVTFDGNDFTGSWSLGGMSGTLTGSRRTG